MPYNNIFDTTSYVRKCTLLTDPTTNRINGAPSALGTDVRGSQLNIDLSYLPPGVVLSQIKQGQKWWVEKRTTAWVLYLYVGEFNPYSYALFNSTKDWTPKPNALQYQTIIYDKIVKSIPSSMGSIISDPTTGTISVPIPGIYDVTASVQTNLQGKNNSVFGYFGAFQSDVSQYAPNPTLVYPMQLSITDQHRGITIDSGSHILFQHSGVYNIEWSGQFVNPGNADVDINVWVRLNGIDVPGSNGIITVPKKGGTSSGAIIAAWNYYINILSGQYIELVWNAPSNKTSPTTDNIYIKYSSTITPGPPIIPSTASVITTVNQTGVNQSNSAGQLGLQIIQNDNPNIVFSGPWSTPSTGNSDDDEYPLTQMNATLALTDNLTFTPQAAWSGLSTDIDPTAVGTYLTVAYRGPVN